MSFLFYWCVVWFALMIVANAGNTIIAPNANKRTTAFFSMLVAISFLVYVILRG